MNVREKKYLFVLIILLPVFWFHQTGCAKEYSFEGADTIPTFDSIVITPPPAVNNHLSPCIFCKPTDEVAEGTWNFKTGNTYMCGNIADAGFIGTNRTFTFFGPSACSNDTGLVMTVYLSIPFDEDKFNIKASHVAFYYYDHFSTQHLFISRQSPPFTLTIESYYAATRLATGTFKGVVYMPNNDTAFISEGRFKVRLK